MSVRAVALALAPVVLPSTTALAQHRPWHDRAGLETAVAEAERDDIWRNVDAEMALGNDSAAWDLLPGPDAGSTATSLRLAEARGQAAFGTGRFAEAAFWFGEMALASSGTRRAIAHARAGRALEAAGEVESALEHYRLAGVDFPLISGWMAISRARLVEDSIALGLLQGASPGATRLSLAIAAGVRARSGDPDGAVLLYRQAGYLDSAFAVRLGSDDPAASRELAYEAVAATQTAEYAMQVVDSLFPPVNATDFISLTRGYLALGRNVDAIRSATRAIELGDSSGTIYRLLGRAQERAGRRSDALASYLASANSGGDDGVRSQYSRGRLLLAMRRFDSGLAAQREFFAQHPRHSFTPAALRSVAARLYSIDHHRAADSAVTTLHESWTTSAQASEMRLLAAESAWERGDSASALMWLGAEVEAGGRERHRARYRIAEWLRVMDEGDSADSVLAELAAANPLGYYGARARWELEMPLPVFAAPDDAELPPRVDTILRRFDFLRAAGMERDAEIHLDYWTSNDSLADLEVLSLAEGLNSRGETRRAISLGWRASRAFGSSDGRVVRTIFPWPYRDLIESEGREWGVDPYLVAAIIRQESAFDPDATSRAGARGLMQLMPATASWRARQMTSLRWNERYLAVPDANLHVGVGHLSDLLERSDDLVFALAAYNAGGGNLARWRRRPGMNDPDTFIEKIPFPETRSYVKAVLRNYDLYRALYGGT